jgi:hypothetical protein
MRENLPDWPGFPNLSLVHEDDLIGNAPRESHLMRYQHHGHTALGEVLHDLKHFNGQLGIEGRGSLRQTA